MTKTLVLGIGNNLLTDEGAGIHVIQHLREICPESPEITFLDGGTLSFVLASELAVHERLIIVDAAQMGLKPGEIACFEGADMDSYLKGNRKSVHEVGLTDLLDIARLSGHFPQKRALIGIQPLSLDWGEAPTAAVAAAVPEAASMILSLITAWER
jgi:hydrogenase maturation protease